MNRQDIPAFVNPESVASALSAMWTYSEHRRRVAASVESVSMDPRDPMLNALPAGSLNEVEAKTLFARFGIASVRERVVTSALEAQAAAREFGGKVVLKLLSNEITHKSEVGGVAVGVSTDEIGARRARMRDDVQSHTGSAPKAFLVQEMVTGGTELIFGLHRDSLGTAILLGMGGVTAELFKDTTMKLLPAAAPLSRDDALAMLQSLKTWPLLNGYRGRPRADVDAAVSAIAAFSRMARQLGARIVEAEINPVFVLREGQGVLAADGVAVIKSA